MKFFKKKSEKRKHASFHFDIGKVYATTSNEQKELLISIQLNLEQNW